MKKMGVLFGLTAVMVLSGGLRASAQTSFNFQMSSSFYAGNAKMPAGSYTLKPMDEDANTFTLENSAGTHSVVLEVRQSSKASKGKPEILFNRYGTTDYLEAVETSDGSSIDIAGGAAEKLAAKKSTAQPHTVPVA
jgi:hypothetical protein